MEKRVLLRAAAVRNSAAAKENCGRKSLLIEHEVCHLKLESSQTPETAAGRHLSGPYIKVPPGPGCVSPSHRGPFALAGAPFRLRAQPHRGTSRRVRCAINAPTLRRLGSRYHSFPRKRRRAGEKKPGRFWGGEVTNPRIHAKYLRPSASGAGEGRHTTRADKSAVWPDLAALAWAFCLAD